ncbi:H-NS histone family protein [Iodobacter fluviatilis]|uniref:Transcriptional regulator n=1 Tax=Iodobacter fluviatilis TaxID=537 RepID=A0A7G3GFM3_9NEIS|nr:H-NS histone family protein [Iodobacter fluviatilis]QBC45853.1 transcriptional regulator [Iodobacter fluviatilis]
MASLDISNLSYLELVDLQKQVAHAINEKQVSERAALIADFQQKAAANGFTLAELLPQLTSKRPYAKSASTALYANPADKTQTWAGRGRKPTWLVEALAAGRTVEDFKI